MSSNRKRTMPMKKDVHCPRCDNPISSTKSVSRNLSIKYAICGFSAAVLLILATVYYGSFSEVKTSSSPRTIPFAGANDIVANKTLSVVCHHNATLDRESFRECAPPWCGRVVSDSVVSVADANRLLDIAKAGFNLGGGDGGITIFELNKGDVSKGDRFINLYKLTSSISEAPYRDSDFQMYNEVINTMHATISKTFGIREDRLFLTMPTFFSRMNARPARTRQDEYWHSHVDRQEHLPFYYSAILYLSDYGSNFTGGRFVFSDNDGRRNLTVEPKHGRFFYFTSGPENRHFVEKVESGTRYALNVFFTCDPMKAIDGPKMPSM